MMNNNCQEQNSNMESLRLCCNKPFHFCSKDRHIKSVQSALSDLLTTSATATHGTFSRPSTKRGLIL